MISGRIQDILKTGVWVVKRTHYCGPSLKYSVFSNRLEKAEEKQKWFLEKYAVWYWTSSGGSGWVRTAIFSSKKSGFFQCVFEKRIFRLKKGAVQTLLATSFNFRSRTLRESEFFSVAYGDEWSIWRFQIHGHTGYKSLFTWLYLHGIQSFDSVEWRGALVVGQVYRYTQYQQFIDSCCGAKIRRRM